MKSVLRLLLLELKNPLHYVIAIGVGSVLSLVRGFQSVAAVAPFVVPFLLSSAGRAAARVANQRRERLLELPAQRSSPVFVMCADGTIEDCLGKTRRLFEQLGVKRIGDFLQAPAETNLPELIRNGGTAESTAELYAPAVERWYRFATHRARNQPHILVWLEDTTEEHAAFESRARVRQFQIEALQDFSGEQLRTQSYERLTRLILDAGYQTVLFARQDGGGALTGVAFKTGGGLELVRSGSIRIESQSHAPILRSRSEGRAVAVNRAEFASDRDFDHKFPVAPEVREFIGKPVDNLVNYHAGATSIVAFNKQPRLARGDLLFMEAAVDAAHSLFTAIGVAEDRDLRFIQAIHGLCASAEFSDEITGAHIWRVNTYAALLADSLCAGQPLCRDIEQVAAAHDIGKVAIPELVQAPRALSRDEWSRMQLHTVYGAQILDRMIQLSEKTDQRLLLAREIALNHHQRWDGKGYPGLYNKNGEVCSLSSRDPTHYAAHRPLKGAEIPLSARIVSVCDAYDALRAARPYKAAMDHDTAVSLLSHDDRSSASGSDRFGPEVFAVFMDNHSRFAEVYETMR